MKNDTAIIFGEFSGSYGWKNIINTADGYCMISTMLIHGNMDSIAEIVTDKQDDSRWETMIFKCDSNGNISKKSYVNPLAEKRYKGYAAARIGHKNFVERLA